jgi:poly(hydroxyalkanoate) depolymerase family esterase
MNEATRLTRAGDIGAAVAILNKALVRTASEPDEGRKASAKVFDGNVVDVEARVISDPQGRGQRAPLPSDATGDQSGPAAALAADVASMGIDASLTDDQWLAGTFAHQGRTVTYKLFIPSLPGPREKPALVVMLHGCTQNAEDFARGTEMNALAREAGVIVLYPEQTQRANAQRCWNWFKTQHQQRGRGEAALLAELTKNVTQTHGIDPGRVYVAGLSAGGAMADILGRTYPDVFAAVGVHSGLPHGSASDMTSALQAMRSGGRATVHGTLDARPLIVFHGDSDHTVHPTNGQALADAAIAGGRGVSSQGETTRGSSARGSRYTRTCYRNAAGAVTVEHWLLQGASHAWSGGSSEGSYTAPAGVQASAEMLRFFMTHRIALKA